MTDQSMKSKEKWQMHGLQEEIKKKREQDLHLFKKKNNKRKILLIFRVNMMKKEGKLGKKYLSK